MSSYAVEGPERLDRFLVARLPQHTRSRLSRAIDEGHVRVPGQRAKAGLMLKAGWTVEIDELADRTAHDLTPAEIPLDVVYESEACLVVNKPRGLATHPAASLREPSLVNALLGRGGDLSGMAGEFRPGIVHRLDKETTGLIVVAKSDAAHANLARQIETRAAGRRYLTIVAGRVAEERFAIDAPIARNPAKRDLMAIDRHGKVALTRFKRIVRLDRGTLLGARLETGRTHQIRVHLASVGLPVLGDPLYGTTETMKGPMLLHAAFLAFQDPSGGDVQLFAPPPPEFGLEVGIDALEPF